MRIGIVCDWYLPRIGGLELHLRDLAQNLARHGHEVHLACVTPEDASAPTTPFPGVHIHRLPLPLMPRFSTVRGPEAIRAVTRFIEDKRIDVVHTHNAFSPLAHLGAYAARRLGVPSLFTECSVLRGQVGHAFRLFGRLVPWGQWPTLLSGVSRFVAEDVRRASGREEVFVLHNGIDLDRWKVTRREPSRPRVASVMRFTLRKRPWDIVRMIPRIHRQLPPDLRPTFTIVGDGPEMANVRRVAERLGVLSHLELPGRQPRERIAEILAESTVFALPTRKEAMSIASLEALASSCPVVAMNLGGVSDVVEHGSEGFLAESLDEMADYVAQLIRNDELRRQMVAHSGARLARFAWSNVVARHVDLFNLAAQRVGRSSGEDLIDIAA